MLVGGASELRVGDSRWLSLLLLTATVLALGAPAAVAATTFVMQARTVPEEKAVFATVESRNVVPARTRIGGTVSALAVKIGDHVAAGQVLAAIRDKKLGLQIKALDAQIVGLRSQLAQAQADLGRANSLSHSGAVSRQQLDLARTAVDVATSALNARIAQRSVTERSRTEGAVLAPIAGRVLSVPVTNGSVVLQGDPVATIAEQNFVLRLRVPERHALLLKAGDTVRLDGNELGEGAGKTKAEFGTVTLVYPQIGGGQVSADATAPGIGQYFVGERIRVWVPAGERRALVAPARFIFTRFGIDYVRLRQADGTLIDAPVQRGLALPTKAMPDGVEILAGLSAGEVLVQP